MVTTRTRCLPTASHLFRLSPLCVGNTIIELMDIRFET